MFAKDFERMCTLTHTSAGIVLGTLYGSLLHASGVEVSGLAVIVITTLVSNAPDIDAIPHLICHALFGKSFVERSPMIRHRRTPSHSIFAIPLFALLATLLLAQFSLSALSVETAVATTLFFAFVVGSHLLMDAIDNSEGVALFSPFSFRLYRFKRALTNKLEFSDLWCCETVAHLGTSSGWISLFAGWRRLFVRLVIENVVATLLPYAIIVTLL